MPLVQVIYDQVVKCVGERFKPSVEAPLAQPLSPQPMLVVDALVEGPVAKVPRIKRVHSAPSALAAQAPRLFEEQREQPTSPCLIDAVSSEASLLEDKDRRALQTCQRIVIGNYVQMAMQGLLRLGLTDGPMIMVSDGCESPLCHPIQDPTGAITLALLIVRRHRPGNGGWMPPPFDMNLCLNIRRGLAAIVTVAHKMTAHTSSYVGNTVFVKEVIKKFWLPHEWPKYYNDWDREADRFRAHEMAVLEEPMLSMVTTNPLSQAEQVIGILCSSGKMSKHTSTCFRGAAFFFIGASMLNPAHDVLGTLADQIGPWSIGEGCVSLLLTLEHCVGSTAEEGVLYRPPFDHNADRAARVLLYNGMLSHAELLRMGPYRSKVVQGEKRHPVQQLLAPENLEKARRVLSESSGSSPVPL